jgi:hypothetical protein
MRNARIIILVLGLLGATGATNAAADIFRASSYPVSVTGSKDGEFTDELVTTSGSLKCTTPTYVATHSGDSSSSTVTPSLSGCTAFGFPAAVDVNGCRNILNIAGGVSTEGDMDISCTGGNEITITAISAGTTKCTVHIPSQSDIGGTVKYKNIGSGSTQEVTGEASFSGIDYSHTKGTGLGACTAGSATNATITAKGVVTGETDGGGTHVGLFVT